MGLTPARPAMDGNGTERELLEPRKVFSSDLARRLGLC